jgi:hypothetical protein
MLQTQHKLRRTVWQSKPRSISIVRTPTDLGVKSFTEIDEFDEKARSKHDVVGFQV